MLQFFVMVFELVFGRAKKPAIAKPRFEWVQFLFEGTYERYVEVLESIAAAEVREDHEYEKCLVKLQAEITALRKSFPTTRGAMETLRRRELDQEITHLQGMMKAEETRYAIVKRARTPNEAMANAKWEFRQAEYELILSKGKAIYQEFGRSEGNPGQRNVERRIVKFEGRYFLCVLSHYGHYFARRKAASLFMNSNGGVYLYTPGADYQYLEIEFVQEDPDQFTRDELLAVTEDQGVLIRVPQA